jgi:hypothetical protein
MKVNHCLAILLGLWMIVSAASDALADCGYNKLWLWPEGGYCKNYCDLGLCYLRCKSPNTRGASRPCSIHQTPTGFWVFLLGHHGGENARQDENGYGLRKDTAKRIAARSLQ